MAKYKLLDKTTGVLVTIGAINWGLDVLNFNLVEKLANLIGFPVVGTIIYSLVGISGLWVGVRSLMGKFMK